MRAVLADAVALYAAADESDALHERAMQDFGKLDRVDRTVLVAYPTFIETQTLVLRRMGIEAIYLKPNTRKPAPRSTPI